MSLPPELFELIIDHPDGDILALKMCALACAAFRQRSQSHIFGRITALLPPPSNAPSTYETLCSLFHRLVLQSPHIQHHVRTLVIMDRHMYSTPGRRYTTDWMLDEPTLPLLLLLLPNLEGFHLHSRENWEHVLDENPTLASAILTALASPNIKSIHFRGMQNLPLACITQSTGLRNLLLNDLDIDHEPNPIIVQPKVRLCRLGLSPWTLTRFARADCPFDMTHLLKLRVCPQGHIDQYAALKTLLNAASHSLLEFEYLPFLSIEDVVPELDLGNFPSLQRLVVRPVCGGIVPEHPVGPLLWLAHALDSLPQNSAIAHIVLELEIWWKLPSEGELACIWAWATLDASLTRPALHAATLTIFTELNLNGILPFFAASGRMRIEDPPFIGDCLRYSDLEGPLVVVEKHWG
ncbi:hypothetical protein K438DRAFT_1749089 [Mycena galopus ATCC 62051]|nr:hypothetical protein K438DRAFT_1749089 [Mycena galopus ATCC 62051]